MLPILTVVGATGVQGGSIIASALAAGTYKVRGLTRNVNSAKATALASQGVEVVAADLGDEKSLIQAFHGSTAIYAATDFFEPFFKGGAEHAVEVEFQQGKNLANAAAQTEGLKHFIWSTLPSSMKVSSGKYYVPHFEGKVKIDNYIKSKKELVAKTTFLWVTWYASNMNVYPLFIPTLLSSSGKYIQLQVVPPTVPVLSIGDTSKNLGTFVTAILNQPEKTLNGKYVIAYVSKTTTGGLLESWTKATGRQSLYVQISSLKDYDSLWPGVGEEMGGMMKFWEEAGDKSWSGEELVHPHELGINTEALVDDEKAFRIYDWSKL